MPAACGRPTRAARRHLQGVSNRDLKLENVLLMKDQATSYPMVKICDFGARALTVRLRACVRASERAGRRRASAASPPHPPCLVCRGSRLFQARRQQQRQHAAGDANLHGA